MKLAINFLLKNEAIEEWDDVRIQEFALDDCLSFFVYQHDTIDKAKAGIKDRLLCQLTDGIDPYYYQGVSYSNDLLKYSYNTYCSVEGHVVKSLDDEFFEVYYEFQSDDDCEYADVRVGDLRFAKDEDATRYEINTDLGWISGTFITELKSNVSEKRKAEIKPYALIDKVEAAFKETAELIDEYSRVDWNALSAYDVEDLKELAASNDVFYSPKACYNMFQILNDEVSEGMMGCQQESIDYLITAAKKGCTEIPESLWYYLEEEFPEEFEEDCRFDGNSVDRFIATTTAQDLRYVEDGTLAHIYERYGLDVAAKFIQAMVWSDKMFNWEEYIEENAKDREIFMRMGEQHQETAAKVCFYFWWRCSDAHDLTYLEEDFYRYTENELRSGTPMQDTFMYDTCIKESESDDPTLLKLWQPELIKKYGLGLMIPELLAKYADESFWESIEMESDNYPSFIEDLFSVFADYKDSKDVTLILKNLLFGRLFDVPYLCDLIQKYDCSDLLQNILARFTEGDVWGQFESYIAEYYSFVERLFEIFEEAKGHDGLVDFLIGLIPLLKEHIDEMESDDIIAAMREIDLPDDSEVRKFLDEYDED
jgi:hypothetical protein